MEQSSIVNTAVSDIFSATDTSMNLIMAGSNKVGDPENLYQISLLIDHLKHDEVTFREQAARSLSLIGR